MISNPIEFLQLGEGPSNDTISSLGGVAQRPYHFSSWDPIVGQVREVTSWRMSLLPVPYYLYISASLNRSSAIYLDTDKDTEKPNVYR